MRLRLTVAVGLAVACIGSTAFADGPPGNDNGGGSFGIGGSTSTTADDESVTTTAQTTIGVPPPRGRTKNHDSGPGSGGGGPSGQNGTGTTTAPPTRAHLSDLSHLTQARSNTVLGSDDDLLLAAIRGANATHVAPTWDAVTALCTALENSGGAPAECAAPAAARAAAPVDGQAPPPPDPRVVARRAAARMPLPAADVRVGPDPMANEWQMTAVGYPQWLWTDNPAGQELHVSEQGIEIDLVARRASIDFTMGDGTKKTCHATMKWTKNVQPGTPSPVCGHVYQKASMPEGNYRITATEHWDVTWTALGQSGTISVDRGGTPYELPVGELQALVVAGS